MLAADLASAERCFSGAARNSRCAGALSRARQRLSAVLLARAVESEDGGAVRRALAASEAALAAWSGNCLARLCRASALGRLGATGAAAAELRLLLSRCGAEAGDCCDPAARLCAQALLARCCALGGGTPEEAARHARAARAALASLTAPASGCSGQGPRTAPAPGVRCPLPLGHLVLEADLLACAAAVQGLAAATESSATESSTPRDAEVPDGPGNGLGGWATAQEEPRSDMSSFLLPEPCGTAFAEEPPALASAIKQLTYCVQEADSEDACELLWQAYAWRCRAHMLARAWPDAVSDATKALSLNVFAGAELRGPPSPGRGREPPPGPGAAPEPARPALRGRWSCLRMRAAALRAWGRGDLALADEALRARLAAAPAARPAGAGRAGWSNARAPEAGWRRSSEQRAALRASRGRRGGAFVLPRGP